MFQQLKERARKGLDLLIAHPFRSVAGLLLLGLLINQFGPSPTSITKPTATNEFASTSVILMDKDMKSGGSGVILRSYKNYSEILSNKHVCKLLQGGGVVSRQGHMYLVDSVKRYPLHDLCLVRVSTNFGVNTKVAEDAPESFSNGFISGHPALLPHVLTKGAFSGHQIVTLMVGLKDCTADDMKGPYGLYCLIMGGVPILQSFEAQLVTGTILPGSSGSGVFNSSGEISGLVFAGNGGGLGYAFIVPWEYVYDFIRSEKSIKYEEVQQLKFDANIRSIFNVQRECSTGSEKAQQYKALCSMTFQYPIIQEEVK